MREAPPHIAVIGGGIIGLSIASELTRAGCSVHLFEQGALHSATSANSHRIIHGGLRYLQNLDLKRVFRSLAAKKLALERFPESIIPMSSHLIIPEKGLKRSSLLGLAGAVYGGLSVLGGYPTEWSSVGSADQVLNLSPWFEPFRGKKVFTWCDARILEPEILAKTFRNSIENGGGKIFEHLKVHKVSPSQSGGYLLQSDAGESSQFQRVVLALGPWHGTVELPAHFQFAPVGWQRAFNLQIRLPHHSEGLRECAVGFLSGKGQMLFFAPRRESGGETVGVGTWYLSLREGERCGGELIKEEIEGALFDINTSLHLREPLNMRDVVSVELGVLPARKTNTPGSLYGAEEIRFYEGIASVMSTKYTTFPMIAQDIVNWCGMEFK